jgi:hypothetical protein
MENEKTHILLAIHVTNRVKNASMLQALLSEYGCYIKTRLGLHEAGENYCSPNGIIILEFVSDEQKKDELVSKINAIVGVELKEIIFRHN